MLINGNAYYIPLADESVQCVATSPPYWSLRDYDLPPLVWGGERGCEHLWGEKIVKRSSGGGVNGTGLEGGFTNTIEGARFESQSQFCQLCNAWRGSLGLEPTPELYVEHLVAVFREIRRVLKPDGVVFLNLGDSYAASGGGSHKDWHKNPGLSKSAIRGGVPHAASYGTSDKALVNSQEHDCLCENLCGVCREVYRRKPHTYDLLAPMLVASLSASTLERMGLQNDRPPTLDLTHRMNHIVSAILDQGHSFFHGYGPPDASLASMPDEFSRQLLGECWRRGKFSSCLLCGRSLVACAQGSVHTLGDSLEKSLHNLDSALHVDQQAHRSQCKDTVCEYCSRILTPDPPYIQPYCTTDRPISQILKPKDLVGIPWRVALALQANGWYLRSEITWCKTAPMPESMRDRPTSATEKVFLLTKNSRYFYDSEAVKVPSKHPNDNRKARGNTDQKRMQGGNEVACVRPGSATYPKRNLWNYWILGPEPYRKNHFAVFPTKLVEPMILAGTSARGECPVCGLAWLRVVEKEFIPQEDVSPERGVRGAKGTKLQPNDGWDGVQRGSNRTTTTGWQPQCDHDADPVPQLVLDPFAGTATVGRVCIEHGRHFIGLELNPDYIELAMERTNNVPVRLF